MSGHQHYDHWWDEMQLMKKYPIRLEAVEYFTAQRNFIEYTNARRIKNRPSFDTFMGNDWRSQCGGRGHMTQEAADKIQMLLSPHRHALLKAYYLRKSSKK